MTTATRRLRLALVVGALSLLGSCKSELIAPSLDIKDLISGVTASSGAITATLHDTTPPTPGSGPTAQVAGISTVVNGGSATINVTSGQQFQHVYVSVSGANGYWDVVLPAGVATEDLVLSASPTLHAGNMRVQYQLVSGTSVGPVATQTVRVIAVGTGDVQVSVAWTGATDVDLHVIDPASEEIYFGHKTSVSGGKLDLDSNPACNIDNKNNENVVWPVGKAPTGQYQVLVYYYDACQKPRSDWVVTVLVKGKQPQTFTGSFVGDAGVSNPPAQVVTFTY